MELTKKYGVRFRAIALCLTLFFFCKIYSQKQTNNWLFSDSNMVNFNTPFPTSNNSNLVFAFEASASVSDTSGNLLFYTNGESVRNRFGQYMLNGGLWTSQFVATATEGTLIVPKPGSTSQYYLILNNNFCGGAKVLYYTIVDMSLNGGLGDVLFPPVLFYTSPTTKVSEKISVVKHCNGKDFWLVSTEVYFYGDSLDHDPIKYAGQRMKNAFFLSFLIDEYGINNYPIKSKTHVITNICEPSSSCATGQLKISPDGELAAFGHFQDLYLFSFNNSSGTFNHINTITYTPDFNIPAFCDHSNYGLEFFNDSKKIMFNNLFVDLVTNDTTYLGNFIYSQMQLASDGKIYFGNNTKLPNQFGISTKNDLSFFEYKVNQPYVYYDTVSLKNGFTTYGLPNFPSYYFHKQLYDFEYSGHCANTAFTFTPQFNGNLFTSVEWTFTDDNTTSTSLNPSHIFSTNGSFEVKLVVFNGLTQDTISHCADVLGNNPNFFSPDDLFICKGNTVDIGTTYPNTGLYKWNTGDTTAMITASAQGTYILNIKNQCADYTDTITVIEKDCRDKSSEMIIPNVFTPNDDNINDYWRIILPDGYKLNYLEIYNRWGNVIFTSEGTIKPWFGRTSSGEPCSDGVYFYILKYADDNNVEQRQNGFISLHR